MLKRASCNCLLAPVGGAADPSVGAELCVEVGRERAFVAGGKIGFYVSYFAHAGNDGADAGIVEDETQREFGERRASWHERRQFFRAIDSCLEIFGIEIAVAP